MHPYLEIMSIRLIAFGWSEWVRFCETFAETEPPSFHQKLRTISYALLLTYRMSHNEHECKKEQKDPNIIPTTMSTSGIYNIVSSGHGWTICATMTEQTNSQQPQTPHQIWYIHTNIGWIIL
jgi:hypothetical protein